MADEARSVNDRFQLRWTLARKIGGLASLLVVLLIVNAVYNYRALGNIGGELSEISKADMPVTRLIFELNTSALQQHVALERVLRLGATAGEENRAERERAAAEFESLSRQFATDFENANRAVDEAARITSEYQRFGEEV